MARGRSLVPAGIRAFALSLIALSSGLSATPISTPGKHGVAPTGAATYSVPVHVVMGTSGMQPALSLNYSSQGGDGMIGVGWSLSGLSVVSRCARTLEQDGARGSINFDLYDRYCLDGARLMPTGVACPSGGTEYRTEIESFNRVCAFGSATTGNASQFLVKTKSGLDMWYGTTADSYIEAQGRSEALVWALQKVVDRKGNYYTVSYGEDAANSAFWPLRIDYTGNENVGATLTPYASVRFTYADQSEYYLTTAYVGGSRVAFNKLLKTISTYEGESVARTYRLDHGTTSHPYDGIGQRPRLKSITEEGQGGLTKLPTTFSYQADSTVVMLPRFFGHFYDGQNRRSPRWVERRDRHTRHSFASKS